MIEMDSGYKMNKLAVGILVFSFSVALFAADKLLNGFGKIKWGAPINKYKDVMHLTSENDKLKKFYVIKHDDLLLDDINLTSISYVFYKDKFSSVIIQTDRSSYDLKKIINKYKNIFGKPFYSNKYINKFIWKNETTIVNLKCFSSSHKCSIVYKSVAMNKIEKADNVTAVNN